MSSASESTIARCRRTLVAVIAIPLVIAGCIAAPSATDSAPPPVAQTSAVASPSPSTESTPMPDPLPTEIITDPDAALLQAAETGDAAAATRALSAGADIEARNDLQQTALLLASSADPVHPGR